MFAVGLVLLVIAGVFTLGVTLSNTDPVPSASAFGVSLSNVSLGGLFLAGAVAGALIMLGISLMVAGAARKRRRRVDNKRTVRGVRSEKEQLAAENSDLRSQLDSTGGQAGGAGSSVGTERVNAGASGPRPAGKEKHGLFGRR